MTTTYTFDVFSSLDGFGAGTDEWSGYWGKQGPELLDHRARIFAEDQLMVFGPDTYRMMSRITTTEPEAMDLWVRRMSAAPKIVVSTTMGADEPLDWGETTLRRGSAVDVVAELKETSSLPLRSHGSLRLNWSLMAAGLVDRLQVTIFPVITGLTGVEPVLGGAADFDLELVESTRLDGDIQELVYVPRVHQPRPR
ncbi:dihydrofolate reductase [Brevibacterium sanguinis]|uniref:Dihydrofolate reductase n=2 Tax=Brevibacterium TaxID=1696 RepID=A0A366IP49_9MICO|nr:MULTISPECIES: dihydrofolate reductase family protein [Brevibacterium]RBP67154.1 dihydrofolate reductase [Brevibacterium sanguinis]RBP73679.1 dihydrofolate reductase [Brevibacterium celere]